MFHLFFLFSTLVLSNNAIAADNTAKSAAATSDVTTSPNKQNYNTSSALAESSCSDYKVPIGAIYSKSKIEEVISQLLSKNVKEFGELHWTCIVQKFEQQDERLKVKIHEETIIPKDAPPFYAEKNLVTDVYEFTVDRSWHILAILYSFGPGASNGVFTAIINLVPDDRVAVIQRGGKPKWLALEQRPMMNKRTD